MKKFDLKKFLQLNFPYFIIFYLVDKTVWLFRHCVGDIVKVYVILDSRDEFFSARKLSKIVHLGLQDAPPTFHRSIVKASADTGHTLDHSCINKFLVKHPVCILKSSVTMEDRPCIRILKYIFQGGVYGSAENHIAVDKSRTTGSAGYVLNRLFPSYKYIVAAFPCLRKAPYLLPFCWLVRLVRALFGGKSKRIMSEISCANNMSDEKLEEVTFICSRLGLQ